MTDSEYTHIAVVVDRSGSMYPIATDMDGAIKELLTDQAKQPGYVLVDVITFDTEVEYPYTGVRADDVKGELIKPRGSTALNDAVGKTIVRLGEKFAGMREEERPGHVLVVVVTDGMENASREYTLERVRELVEQQRSEWGWEFLYLAANVDAFATGAGYGFGKGSTVAFEPSAMGTQNVASAASMYITRSRNDEVPDFTEDERAASMEK